MFRSKSEKQLHDHVKVHNGETNKVTESDHTGEKDSIPTGSEGVMSPEHVKYSMSAKNVKRVLSVSPEVVDTNKKTLRSNNVYKNNICETLKYHYK